jgi:hypothetical protein
MACRAEAGKRRLVGRPAPAPLAARQCVVSA